MWKADPGIFADYINVNAEHAALTYTFKIVDTIDCIEYKLIYSFNIRKDLDEHTNINETVDTVKYKTIVFNEQLKLSYEHGQKK